MSNTKPKPKKHHSVNAEFPTGLVEAIDNRVNEDFMYMNRSDFLRTAARKLLKEEGYID